MHVVEQVVPLKMISNSGALIPARSQRQIQWEIKVEGSGAVRAESSGVVAVHIFLSGNVIAPGVGELSACDSVGILPSKRRSDRIIRVHHRRIRPVHWILG